MGAWFCGTNRIDFSIVDSFVSKAFLEREIILGAESDLSTKKTSILQNKTTYLLMFWVSRANDINSAFPNYDRTSLAKPFYGGPYFHPTSQGRWMICG